MRRTRVLSQGSRSAPNRWGAAFCWPIFADSAPEYAILVRVRSDEYPYAIGKVRQQLTRGRQGKSCLTNTTGAREVDEPMGGQTSQDVGKLVLSADQFGHLSGQVGQRLERPGCRHRGHIGRLVRGDRQNPGLACELVTTSGYPADQPVLPPQRFAQCDNLGRQIVLLTFFIPSRPMDRSITACITVLMGIVRDGRRSDD
jgi:hypothetical protein